MSMFVNGRGLYTGSKSGERDAVTREHEADCAAQARHSHTLAVGTDMALTSLSGRAAPAKQLLAPRPSPFGREPSCVCI